MKDVDFNKEKRALNKQYFELFDEVPCMQNYSCSREEYISALKKAINMKEKLETLLQRNLSPINKESLT